MKVRIARDRTVKQLRDGIQANLGRYRAGNFDFLAADPSQWHELDQEGDESIVSSLPLPTESSLMDVQYSRATHQYLSAVSPYDARDERLWVYLAHTVMLPYVQARWPIPSDDEKAVLHVRRHFFAQTNRQVERDNAVSRLWWMAHLCSRLPDVPLDAALDAFLLRSDVRANIVERPTVAQSLRVFSAIIKLLITSQAGAKALFERVPFRRLMVEINSEGGFRLLDALPSEELDRILDEIVVARLGIIQL